jgi:hypothetical protein
LGKNVKERTTENWFWANRYRQLFSSSQAHWFKDRTHTDLQQLAWLLTLTLQTATC